MKKYLTWLFVPIYLFLCGEITLRILSNIFTISSFEKLKYAKKNALVMHPGPMNRGVEIDSKVADDVTRSLIQNQVSMGVAIRMACLKILIDNKDIN